MCVFMKRRKTTNTNYTNNYCDIAYVFDQYVEQKFNRLQAVCRITRRTVGRRTRRETVTKYYKVMVIPTLLYGFEKLVKTKKDPSRIQTAEMPFL